jgi:Transposase DDE domain
MRGYACMDMGMYLRLSQRRNRDGSSVAYYGLAENVWNPPTRRAEARVVHSFGRADRLDRDALKRLVRSINRVLEEGERVDDEAGRGAEIEIERVFELGVVLVARALWEELGIGRAIRRRLEAAGLSAPHETALFAMAANRLEDPASKLACAERWLPDGAWLPEAAGLKVDQLYRALDVLAAHAEALEQEVFLTTADLFRLDVDLIFYDSTTAWFAVDDEDEGEAGLGLRRRGHAKDGPEGAPQVVVALAVTRDGMPVRSWVLPGDTADVATVARIKDDLRAWRLGRCVLVGDAGLYSADNLGELARGLGRYVLAVPMRRLKEVEAEVLARPGRYRKVADNLQVKEVWVGRGERRRRYVVGFNPEEAERQRRHRNAVLYTLAAELGALDAREANHPKAACHLLASRRFARYLTTDEAGRPRIDPARVKAAERLDGKFVVTTNDDTLSAADAALGYKGAWIIEACFRKLKTTGLAIRPVYHWSPRRIVAHVKLCVLALQLQRAAELRSGLSWARLAHELAALKAVRYRSEARTIVQRTRIAPELAAILKTLGVSKPKRLLAISEPRPSPPAP